MQQYFQKSFHRITNAQVAAQMIFGQIEHLRYMIASLGYNGYLIHVKATLSLAVRVCLCRMSCVGRCGQIRGHLAPACRTADAIIAAAAFCHDFDEVEHAYRCSTV